MKARSMNDFREPEYPWPGKRPLCRTQRTNRKAAAFKPMEKRIVSRVARSTRLSMGPESKSFPSRIPPRIRSGVRRHRPMQSPCKFDGEIVMVGSAEVPIDGGTQSQQQFAVAEVETNGQLDTSFGTGGQETIPISPNGGVSIEDTGNAVAIQPDGKILIAGSTEEPGNVQVFTVLRLMPNGSLDSTFGIGGVQTVAFPGSASAAANAIALQSNGDIVVAGETETVLGVNAPDFAVADNANRGAGHDIRQRRRPVAFPSNPNQAVDSTKPSRFSPTARYCWPGLPTTNSLWSD